MMKGFLAGVAATLAAGTLAGAGMIYSGRIDVAADTPHSNLVFRLLETARNQAIDRQVRDIVVPADLSDDERIRRGAGNYAAMCVECHLAPGRSNSEIRSGLYPVPPDLTREAPSNAAARQFWVIKHGIKSTGMPAWSKGGIEDEAIWDLVAFVQKLPAIDADRYASLVEASDGHSHGGMDGSNDHHDEAASEVPHDPTGSAHGHPDKAAPGTVPQKKPHDPTDGHAH